MCQPARQVLALSRLSVSHQNGEGQGAFSDANLKSFAVTNQLDTAKFNTCFDSRATANVVRQDEALARSIGADGTPTVLVNGKLVQTPWDATQLQKTIDAALAAQ